MITIWTQHIHFELNTKLKRMRKNQSVLFSFGGGGGGGQILRTQKLLFCNVSNSNHEGFFTPLLGTTSSKALKITPSQPPYF